MYIPFPPQSKTNSKGNCHRTMVEKHASAVPYTMNCNDKIIDGSGDWAVLGTSLKRIFRLVDHAQRWKNAIYCNNSSGCVLSYNFTNGDERYTTKIPLTLSTVIEVAASRTIHQGENNRYEDTEEVAHDYPLSVLSNFSSPVPVLVLFIPLF